MVSLSDIARKVKLDLSVVSRALNPNPDRHAIIKAETRELILQTAKQMGYVPNRQASFNSRKGDATIYCFLPKAADRLIADLMFGISIAAGRENFPVKFLCGSNHEDFRKFLESMTKQAHSGLITYPPFSLSEDIRKLLHYYNEKRNTILLLNVPTNTDRGGLEEEYRSITQICIDDAYGGELVAQHFLDSGCREFYGTYLKPSPYVARLDGFRRIIESAGFEMKMLDTEEEFRRLSGKKHKVGIYADRDVHACNVLILLARAGITPGDKVLLAGNDDKQQSRYSLPPLTTIHQPMRNEGELAVRKLINIIFGHRESNEKVKPYLIVRQSTGNNSAEYVIN